MPTPWRTLIAEERGWFAPLVLVLSGGALLIVQAIGTFGIKERTAQMLFAFGGDGIGMVLATALMGTFFFGKHTQLYRSSTCSRRGGRGRYRSARSRIR